MAVRTSPIYLLAISGVACCSLISVVTAAANQPPGSGPLFARDSLKQIVVDPGLSVELVAEEPNVIDPVAIRFDEDGRMWVTEMRDYPTGPTQSDPARSRISILTDKDGDGLFETATVFADDLDFATGVQPWRGGAFVTSAGRVAYMKDTNGDGKADLNETWYTGFAQANTQLRANHPRLAPDNYIYVANGLRGGAIVDAQHPEAAPVSISGRDFRFDPLTRKFEAVSGVGQFGLTFDDFGNRFVCTNRNPAIHVVLEDRFLRKNPLLAVAAVSTDIAKAGPDSRLFPIGRSWTTSNLHANQFTAACGVDVYRGNAMPAAYYNNILTCDPTQHLVHREVVKPHGVTFASAPATPGSDFFASRDPWCCPVNLEVGPDGALYVVDMYREIIEHPEWMPEELRNRPNLRAGNDRGRIFRVVPSGFRRPKSPKLSQATTSELVAKIAHPNAWWRETAARLLLERQDMEAVPLLRNMTRHTGPAAGRVQALHALDGLHRIDNALLSQLLGDRDPRVVEQAIALSEHHVAKSETLRRRVAELALHSDPRVRFQALLVATALPPVPTHPTDIWEVDAMLVAAGQRGGEVLARMLAHPAELKQHLEKPAQFVHELAKLAAASKDQQQKRIALDSIFASPEFGRAALSALLNHSVRSGQSLDEFRAQLPANLAERLNKELADKVAIATDESRPELERSEAIDLAAYSDRSAKTLLRLALDDQSQVIRIRAMNALARTTPATLWSEILSAFNKNTPEVQRVILDNVLANSDRTALLLDEIEAGRIKPAIIDPVRAKWLLSSKDNQLKARAAKLLAMPVPADREKALANYRPALDGKADPVHGRSVFEKRCAVCHRIGNTGVQLAPDISDSRERTPLQLLTDILQPNRAIDSNYYSYTAITSDGRVHTGVLGAETSTSITLKQQEGKSETLERDQIDDLHSDGISYMPEGIEKDIPPQDMADLIAYIKNWRYLDSP